MAFAMSSARSAFVGQGINCQSRIGGSASRVSVVVQSKKVCDLLGTKRNKANTVSFSNKRSRKWQEPNLQNKRIYWPAGQRWVSLKLSTRAIKTIEKNGLDAMAKEANIDLWKLPFVDNRPERKEYLEHNKGKVPVAENPRLVSRWAWSHTASPCAPFFMGLSMFAPQGHEEP